VKCLLFAPTAPQSSTGIIRLICLLRCNCCIACSAYSYYFWRLTPSARGGQYTCSIKICFRTNIKFLTLMLSNAVYINWRDVQKQNVVNNEDRSSLRIPWQNGPYKNNTSNSTNHAEQQDVTDIQNKLSFVCFDSFLVIMVTGIHVFPQTAEVPMWEDVCARRARAAVHPATAGVAGRPAAPRGRSFKLVSYHRTCSYICHMILYAEITSTSFCANSTILKD